MSNDGEVVEAGTTSSEGGEDELGTLFFHLFEAVAVLDKVSDDNSDHIISVHKHHRFILFNNVIEFGCVENMIEVGVGTALVFAFGFVKPELGELFVRVVSLEDLVFGRRVDRLGRQPLDLQHLDSEGIALVIVTSMLM